jgi:hypothetical protein
METMRTHDLRPKRPSQLPPPIPQRRWWQLCWGGAPAPRRGIIKATPAALAAWNRAQAQLAGFPKAPEAAPKENITMSTVAGTMVTAAPTYAAVRRSTLLRQPARVAPAVPRAEPSVRYHEVPSGLANDSADMSDLSLPPTPAENRRHGTVAAEIHLPPRVSSFQPAPATPSSSGRRKIIPSAAFKDEIFL